MFYTIYKTTNKINGKIYIGKHQTKDLNDGYMGSGKHLKRAIAKYGIENFKREILFQFGTEAEMNAKEAELVTEDFCLREDTYNICAGGKGGWGYINSTGLRTKGHNEETNVKRSNTLKGKKPSDNTITAVKKAHMDGKIKYDNTKGKNISEEHKVKISIANSKMIGDKNSQYNTVWITNGKDNKKILTTLCIPEGWYIGRTYPPRLLKIDMCNQCKLESQDRYWWELYLKLNLSVSKFVKEVFPYNRASFYNMKKRVELV
jgi:hypothetical protein